MESKALEKSKIAMSVWNPESSALEQYSIASISWVSKRCFDLKPCCHVDKMLFDSRNQHILDGTMCWMILLQIEVSDIGLQFSGRSFGPFM